MQISAALGTRCADANDLASFDCRNWTNAILRGAGEAGDGCRPAEWRQGGPPVRGGRGGRVQQ
eukprot:5804594-Pleurochrysis_carterae.AAC.1